MGSPLDNAKALYMEGIRDGDLRAVERFTGNRYTQHSSGIRSGTEGFIEFFEPFLERNPQRDIEIVRSVEDGRYAFLHAYQSLNDGAHRWVTMDLFDSDPQGQIIEHWDVIQPFTETTSSGHGQVSGESEIQDLDQTDANKERVLEFTKRVLQEGQTTLLPEFVAPNLIQHSPAMADGRQGLEAWLACGEGGDYEMLFRLIGQGNFVVTLGKRHRSGQDLAVFDIYRLQDGLLVEHWDTVEEILPRDQWGNSGKF